MTEAASVRVAVGLLADGRGLYLVNRRRAETHMSGAWEFPGGKVEPAETARQALDRELAEELGIEVLDAELVLSISHDYPDRHVELEVFTVSESRGRPVAREAQAMRWVSVAELRGLDLLAADRPIIDWLASRLNKGSA